MPFSRCSTGWRPLFGQLPEPIGAIDDDRLRLIFTCCHPAFALETRVALTLHWLGLTADGAFAKRRW